MPLSKMGHPSLGPPVSAPFAGSGENLLLPAKVPVFPLAPSWHLDFRESLADPNSASAQRCVTQERQTRGLLQGTACGDTSSVCWSGNRALGYLSSLWAGFGCGEPHLVLLCAAFNPSACWSPLPGRYCWQLSQASRCDVLTPDPHHELGRTRVISSCFSKISGSIDLGKLCFSHKVTGMEICLDLATALFPFFGNRPLSYPFRKCHA